MLRSQRPLTLAELADVLAPLGTPVSASELGGGTFSSVQCVELADGRAVAVKTSVPDHHGHNALLTYERDLARVEADMLALLAPVDGVPTAPLLLEDFSRSRVEVDVFATAMLAGTPWDRAEGMRPVMLVEVVPRGFHGDWLAAHLEQCRLARDTVLAHAQATFPAA